MAGRRPPCGWAAGAAPGGRAGRQRRHLAAAYVVGVVPVTVAGPAPAPAAGAGPAPDDDGDGVRAALRTSWFWLATAGLMLGMLGQVGALAHLFHAGTYLWAMAAAAASAGAERCSCCCCGARSAVRVLDPART